MQSVGIQLKDVDENVRGVWARVLGLDESVKMVKEHMQMVIEGTGKESATDAKLAIRQIASNVDEMNRRQLRENLRKWQSPSVPQHRMQTAEWFCGGNTFQEWKATQWFLTVDSRKTWLCKERSMLRDNPKDHRTSRLAQLRWLIYNSTFGMSIKDPAAIYSLHFLSNFLLVLIPFVTYSPTSRMGSTRRLCVWCRHMVLPKFRDY